MGRTAHVLGVATLVLAAIAATPAFGQSNQSLIDCQQAVASESRKYIRAVADTVGKCMLRASSAVIVDSGTPEDEAAACAKLLTKITNTASPAKTLSGRLEARVSEACDPSVNPDLAHDEYAILNVGPVSLSAGNLGDYCQSFGGDGQIDGFGEWLDCLRASAECQARQAIAIQWPRVLEYTAALLASAEIAANPDSQAALADLDAAIEGASDDDLPELSCGAAAGYAGDATASEVLAGATFSNSSAAGLTGTMPNNGAMILTPGTASQSIPAGYHDGSGTCAGDADLAAGNIRSGANIFGVAGSVVGASGNAAAGDVRSGRTFSNAGGAETGTMPEHGAVSLTPGASDQAIAAGYHDGSGKCEGDADLTAGNIRAGAEVFGVAGSVIEASGNAVAANVLSGRTFSSASGAGTGTMPDNGAVTLVPGTSGQAIAAGYHNGSGVCSGDADITEANVRSRVSVFGVEGVVQPGALKTGTDLWHGPGSDGDLEMGAGFRFTNNFDDGTVTDHTTGLMWEKKSDDGSVHDKDNVYTWGSGSLSNGVKEMNGTVATVFLAELNSGSGFAGYTDWRLPNINELLTLARYTRGDTGNKIAPMLNGPCLPGCTVQQCSCTKLDGGAYYMSSTSNQTIDGFVYGVDFSRPRMDWHFNSGTPHVRAVRGGYSGCTHCANEPGTCTFTGTRLVRYGANGKYVYDQFSGSALCNNATFGEDPAPGVPKRCEICESPVIVPLGPCCQGELACTVQSGIDTPAECQAAAGPGYSFMSAGACGSDGACSATPAPGGCCQLASGCAAGSIDSVPECEGALGGTWMPESTCGGDGACH